MIKVGIDYWKIQDYPSDGRTAILESQKNQIIRGEIIMQYTLIDEYLNVLICRYFFSCKKNFILLWKTRRFKNFNYYILENLYLGQKLTLVKSIKKIPSNITKNIRAINDLRNSIVHSFFPENRRRCKPIYKKKQIFSIEGLTLFIEDCGEISNFFCKLR